MILDNGDKRWRLCEKTEQRLNVTYFAERFVFETEADAFAKWKELTGEQLQ